MTRFEIDDMSVVNWSINVSTEAELASIPRVITDLTIEENSLNDPTMTYLAFTDLNSLRTLTIGSNSLQHLQSLSFSELNSLKTLHIGENALSMITTMTISSNSLNSLPSIDLTPFTNLTRLMINSNSLNGLRNMTIDGIDRVVIRDRSLMSIER